MASLSLRTHWFHLSLLVLVLAALLWSGIAPRDRLTWFFETLPAMAALVVLGLTYVHFRFSASAYLALATFLVLLAIGGHYTYGEVPGFEQLQQSLGLSRNYYDRVVHLAGGITGALVLQELLEAFSPLRRGFWRGVVIVGLVLGLSAAYEMVEGLAYAMVGKSAEAFLAIQGDAWDTHWDMALAMLGALVAVAPPWKWLPASREVERAGTTGQAGARGERWRVSQERLEK